jgi:hypothetical protein
MQHPTIMHPTAFWVQTGCIVCLYQFVSEGGASGYGPFFLGTGKAAKEFALCNIEKRLRL